MGVVVTIMNMKGGVGKTTVTLNLAGVLSRYKLNGKDPLKVLMIDYDPQFNLSQAFIQPKTYFALEKDRKTTIAVLIDSGINLNPYTLQVPGNHSPPKAAEIVTNLSKNLDIIPSTLDLMYVALGQATTSVQPIEERFEKFIAECKTLYDILLIDCHPAGSLFTKTSLVNSDFVLIPVIPQKYAVRGIGLMMEFIKAKKAGAKAPKPLILFNAAARSSTSPEEASIRANSLYSPFCLTNTLKRYKAFAEPEGGVGFVWQSTKPYSTTAFRNLLAVAGEIRNSVGL